jgi:hypothetical protein
MNSHPSFNRGSQNRAQPSPRRLLNQDPRVTRKTLFRPALQWLASSWSLVILTAVLTLVTLAPPYANGPPIRSDGAGYHLWTYAILHGDLNFRRYGSRDECGLALVDPERDFYHNKYGPGVALVKLPVMFFLVDPSASVPPFSPAENGACLVFGALALLATAYLSLRASARLGLPDWSANLAVLTIVFGTGLFHYATYDASFSHIWSALGLTLLLVFGLNALRSGGRVPMLATGLLVALLILIRNTNVLAIALLTAGYLLQQIRQGTLRGSLAWKNVLPIVLGGVLGAGIQVGLNSHACGRLTLSSYAGTGEGFRWDQPMQLSVLISLRHGLLVYYPIFAIVLVAGVVYRSTRSVTLCYAALMGAYVVLYGYWHSWFLGAGFGQRGFVELAPLAIPLLGAIFATWKGWARVLLVACALVALLVALELMWGIWDGSLGLDIVTREEYWDHVTGPRSFLRWIYR